MNAGSAAHVIVETGHNRIPVVEGGTVVVIAGPRFSTRAESRLYREWGCDVIGMTASPEYKLAREAELPYALVGMVTDYDCWRESTAAVEVAQIVAQLQANARTARRLVEELAGRVLADGFERRVAFRAEALAVTPDVAGDAVRDGGG